MPLLLALLGSYLVGSLPTAYLVVKRLKRVDVRTVGSGNVGATNVVRAAGVRAGAAVFLVDLLKGLVATRLLARLAWPMTPAAPWACGFAAVVGHCAPVWLQFRGGKGVATTIGVLLGASPPLAGVCAAVWAACFFIWRYVSVASIAAAAALPLAQWGWHRSRDEQLLGLAVAVLVIARHQENIARLRAGTEHRVGRR